jgi:uncharacterized protein
MTQVLVWSGWTGGVAIGLYMLVQLIVTGKPLGASTAYGNLCGLVTRGFFREGEYGTSGGWRLWFLLGLPLGGLLAALTSPASTWTASFDMGALYERVLPDALWAKGLWLVVGGFCIGYGARLAGGCNSGHSIMGMSLLNPPSFVASAGFFVGGIIAVQAMFRLLG